MPLCVILTTDNLEWVMAKTGKSHAYLVKALIKFNARGIYPVKIPIMEYRRQSIGG